MKKFNNYPTCNLFPKFSNLESFNDKSVIIWVIERDDRNRVHLVPLVAMTPQNMKAARHVKIMGMHELCSVPAEGADKKIKLLDSFLTCLYL